MAKRKSKKEKALGYIKNRSIEKPIKSFVIEYLLKIKGERVRKIIADLRHDGEPISSGRKGYYYAYTQEELQPTIQQLTRRVGAMSYVLKSLKNTQRRMDERQGNLL